MNIIQALHWRYAVRKFSDETLAEAEVENLLEAVRLSPSSFGLQPYRVRVVTSPEIRQRLLQYSYGQEKVLKSSHLIVIAVQTDIDDELVNQYAKKLTRVCDIPYQKLQALADTMKSFLDGKTEGQKLEWAHQQAYIALGNLLTCAALMRIDACPMTGFEVTGYDQVLVLGEKHLTTSVICAIGKRHAEDGYAGLPKIRLDYDEMIAAVES